MYYYFARGFLHLLFRIHGGLRSVGKTDFPKSGAVILAPNHVSYADPPAVGCGIARQVHFMAKEELFKVPVLGKLIYKVGSFPVKRGTADRKAIKQAVDLLEQGEVVCIFPEGTRSPDGQLQAPELGIGMIALKSRAPVVPAAVIGTDKVLPAHAKRMHYHPVTVVYGEPLTFQDLYDNPNTRETIEEIGRRVMSAIGKLQAKHKSVAAT